MVAHDEVIPLGHDLRAPVVVAAVLRRHVVVMDRHVVAVHPAVDDPYDAVYDMIGHFCSERPETEKRAELEAAYASWSKRLMMNDNDWRDAVDWAQHDQGQRNGASLYLEGKRALWQGAQDIRFEAAS